MAKSKHFDIDDYINPYIPHNRLYLLPKFVSRWLGHRGHEYHEPPALIRWPISFIATLSGLCLVASILTYAPGIREWNPPVLIASLGATAVLDFNAIHTPLAQPRNAIIGNTLSALLGVCISKLFQLSSDYENITWVSAAFGCACASFIMDFTGTVHPPGGATAVIASITPQVVDMGWKFVPLMLLASTLMICTALIFNNLFRAYPVYWWSAAPTGRKLGMRPSNEKDIETGQSQDAVETVSDASSERTLRRISTHCSDGQHFDRSVHITAAGTTLPSDFILTEDELALLQKLRNRLVNT